MAVLGIIVLVFLAVLVALLVLPLRYRVEVGLRSPPEAGASVQLWPLGGFAMTYRPGSLTGRIFVFGFAKSFDMSGDSKRHQSAKPAKKKRPRPKKARGKAEGETWTWQKIRMALEAGIRLIALIKPTSLQMEGILGFDEPHYTGCTLALLELLRGVKGTRIMIEPVWDEAVCDLDIRSGGQFTLGQIFVEVLRFVMRGPIRRHWTQGLKRRLRPSRNR